MQITVERKRESKLRSANDWIREAKKRPIPRALFGEFWREGETAVLFADTGKGKSVLAMQIAESIASGRGIAPFTSSIEPQTVLYLDMELNDKQFETRYAADHEGGKARFLHKHYVFSDNLIREEFDPAELWMEKGKTAADVFYEKLRTLIEDSKAKVVIVDSINSLKRSYYGSRETLELMFVLKKLRREMDLSILVLVQTPKRPDTLPINVNSLLGLRMLCSRADSVFGIGQRQTDPSGRYIKRVRALGGPIDFDAMHVPLFRLKKIGGNFLGFEFESFSPEIELVSNFYDPKQLETIEKIKGLSDAGKSIREIAVEIELPKTTVHRLLQMWRPPVQEAAAEAAAAGAEPIQNEYYFPGREEFDDALADPKFKKMFETGDEEDWSLRREYGLIESAAAKARQQYLKTGTFTPLDDDPAYVEFLTYGLNGRPVVHLPGPEDGSESAGNEGSPEACTHPLAHLKRALNVYSKEIFIEKEDDRGKPVIWYTIPKEGLLKRWEKDGSYVSGEYVDWPE